MAADTPLNRLVLSAASVADDLGYVALADLAHALGAVTADYRIIGGHMVTMLAGRWQLGAELYRETGDVDLGVPPIVARDYNVVDRLKDLGYTQVAGNRFARRLSDVPLRLAGGENPQPEVFTDAADIWRCLEIALAAGLRPADFADGARAESAAVIRTLFSSRHGPGMTALAAEQHLSGRAADERFTRVRALISRILGPA